MKVKDNVSFSVPVKLKGKITGITKDKDGNIVSEQETNNNILLQIRQPIIKLLGAYGNINMAYNVNGTGWAVVPSTNQILNVTGNVQLQVVPDTLPYIASIAFGSDPTPATINNTGLIAPIQGAQKILAAAPIISKDGLSVTFAVLVGLDELDNQEICEAVLQTVDGTAVARAPIGYYKKIPGMYWEFYWEISYNA